MRKPLQEKKMENVSEDSSKKLKNDKMRIEKSKNILHGTNNNATESIQKKKQFCSSSFSDKEQILKYLNDIYEKTVDISLKYDISKCIEILQGKENMEMTDLKQTLKSVLDENEELEKKNVELMCELEYLTKFDNEP